MIKNFLESCDYENGYKKAVSDIRNYFQSHSESLKFHRMFSCKGIMKLLAAMEKNSDAMMQSGEDVSFKITKENKIILED